MKKYIAPTSHESGSQSVQKISNQHDLSNEMVRELTGWLVVVFKKDGDGHCRTRQERKSIYRRSQRQTTDPGRTGGKKLQDQPDGRTGGRLEVVREFF